jgi:hypothetical protein
MFWPEGHAMNNRHVMVPQVMVPLFTAFMGFAAFINFVSSPAFAAMRTIDVVRLMASGFCFGAAVASLLIFFVGPKLN